MKTIKPKKNVRGGSLRRLARPRVKCPHCEGAGEVPLIEIEWRTLQALGKLGRATAEAVRAELPDEVSVNAYNNRLSRLLRAGLVVRIRTGKYWLYEVA